MQLISVHQGKLIQANASAWTDVARPQPVLTGLEAMDKILPPGGLARGAVHELLFRDNETPVFAAAVLAGAKFEVGGWRFDVEQAQRDFTQFKPACRQVKIPPSDPTSNLQPPTSTLIWSDPFHTLYPPALFAAGVNPRDLWILRPNNPQEELWALAECLRCRGVGATVAVLPARMHRNDVRRLQLAAEHGGGMGIFMRPLGANIYAAATRWLVEPARGERTIQRWKLTLLHGHGGQIGKSFLLERCRENNLVRAVDELGDGSGVAASTAVA